MTPAYCQCPTYGDNIFHPELDKFEGTWKYVNGNTEAILMLKKVHRFYQYHPGSYFRDVIKGVYKVTVNNQVIFDNTNEYLLLVSDNNYPAKFSLRLDCNVNEPNKIEGLFKDDPKEKHVQLQLTYFTNSPPEILVHQYNPERFGLVNLDGTVVSEDLRNPKGTFDPSFTLATDVNFIKQ